MKKFIKNNYKLFIGVIIGAIVAGTSVYAATSIASSSVSYSNTSSGISATNVQSAIDVLYGYMSDSGIKDSHSCLSGENSNTCVISDLVSGKYYMCAINNRGDYSATVTNATAISNYRFQSYLDLRYSSNLMYIKANSSSVRFTVSGTTGMSVICYHIVNVK